VLCLALSTTSPEPARTRPGNDRQTDFTTASGPCDKGESCDGLAEFRESRDAAAEKTKWFEGQRQYPHESYPRDAMRRAARYAKTIPSVRSLEGAPRSSLQSVPGDKWVDIGPAPITAGGGLDASGRISAVAVDPADPSGNTVYVGAASGGVWKTTNGGTSWQPLSDFEASLSIDSIALDPQNSAIVYAGTGESIDGAGVLRSADGGASWDQLGADVFDDATGGARIRAVVLDPTPLSPPTLQNLLNSRKIYVASDDGLYRSLDGGQTWTQALAGKFTDAVVDPTSPALVYAAEQKVGIHKSTNYGAPGFWSPLIDGSQELPSSGFRRINLAIVPDPSTSGSLLFASMEDFKNVGQFKGIWKSANDGGNWSRVTGHPAGFWDSGFVVAEESESENNDTFQNADPISLGKVVGGTISSSGDVDIYLIGLIGDAFAPLKVAANIEIAADRAGSTLDPRVTLYQADGSNPPTMLKTSNSGLLGTDDEQIDAAVLDPGGYYVEVKSADGSTGEYRLSVIGIERNCQCWYDQVIAVNPADPDVMYMGLVRLYRSDDAGVHWKLLQQPGTPNWMHVDFQAMDFHPTNRSTMYWANDGGVWKTTNAGTSWANLNTNLSITQVQPGIAQHPTNAGVMLFGSQDNGVAKLGQGVWDQLTSGDAGFNAIVDDQTWYYSFYFLDIRKTSPTQTGARVTTGLGTDNVFFAAPFLLDPNNTSVLIAGGGKYVASNSEHYVYRTTNGAAQWFKNSPDLGDKITALAFARSNSGTYYAGTYAGKVWRTTVAGGTGPSDWADLTRPPLPNRVVTDLAVSPTAPATAYVTYSGYNSGHVYRTTTGGASWTDISSAPHSQIPLPDGPVNAIAIDPVYGDTLFAGTDLGIYRTTNGGVHWYEFSYGLPRVEVTDLLIDGTAGTLRAATYGRGIWELAVGNDACEDATPISDGIVEGTTAGASSDGAATCGDSSSSPDAWYRYTATCDGVLHVDSCGSSFDTVVSLHAPPCPGSETGCNDDCTGSPCAERQSCLTATVEAGEQFLIRVSGFDGDSGDFLLRVFCTVPNDICDQAIALPVPANVEGSTVGAGVDLAPICNGFDVTAPGVWYTVYGTGNLMTASLCNGDTAYDSKLSIYCAGCGGQGCVTAVDDSCGVQSEVTWCSSPGAIYHILVHGYASFSGQFRLQLSDNGTPCGPALACAPANGTCESATPLSSLSVLGDNTGAGTQAAASCRASSRDVWYEYDPFCHGFLTVDTCGSLGTLSDTVLSVWDECAGVELACNDDAAGCGVRSSIALAAEAGRPFKIRVADYDTNGDQGTFPLSTSLTSTVLAAPPPGFYVVDGDGVLENRLLRLDVFDRSVADVGPLGAAGLSGLAYAPNLGLMYGIDDSIDSDALVTIDLQTGAAAAFAVPGFGSIRSLAFDPTRLGLYGTDFFSGALIEINPFTGETQTIGPIGFGDVQGLTFDSSTGTLYAADNATGQLISIDPATGAGSAIGAFGSGFDRVEGLAYDSVAGVLYGMQYDFASSSSRVLRIDPATGAAIQIGPSYADLGPSGFEYVAGLPDATSGKPYDAAMPVAGGCPFYFFDSGTGYPPGLSIDSMGNLAGTPTADGNFIINYSVGDTNLSTPPINAATPLRVRPSNDLCADAIAVGDGSTPFINHNATTDGPDEPAACDFFGYSQVGSDVWYCYTPLCTGDLTVDLCTSDYDTKVAVYESCGCPASAPAYACNDDACATQSSLVVPVVAGRQYGVRIGGYDEARGGGLLTLSCSGDLSGACCLATGCSVITSADCVTRGGIYQGDGTVCEPDSDGDQFIDACDACPTDPLKVEPGSCGCGSPDGDTDGDGVHDCLDDDDDGDGVPDDADSEPLNALACRDADGDACDDCSGGSDNTGNDGTDADADGICALGDCNDSNGDTYPGAVEVNDAADNQCPGERGYGVVDEISGIAGFLDPNDKAKFSWPAQSGAHEYDIARADNPQFTNCGVFNALDPWWFDPASPPANQGFYYLVRASMPNTGSWGQDSSGAERTLPCF
jgi:photosystem II stability/assembly factor-like uncharacterized protein